MRFKFNIKYFSILPGILFLAFTLRSNKGTVIQVNKYKIGFEEFQDRLNDLPYSGEHGNSINEIKEDLACTIIAETILANEAQKQEINKLPQVKLMLDEFHKEALYEEWMKSEVTSKIKISPEEIQQGYNRLKEVRDVEYWAFPNLKDAGLIREEILKNIQHEIKPQQKRLEYGMAEENVEDTVYGLKVGQVSSPVKVDSLFYVFKLDGIEKDPRYAKEDVGYYSSIIMERIKAKKDLYLMSDKLNVLMKNKGYGIETVPYRLLLSKLDPIIFNSKLPKAGKADLIQQELYTKNLKRDESDNEPLIIFKDGRIWSVREAWERLAVSPYPLNFDSPKDLEYGLPEVIKKIILLDAIANDAEKKGFDKSYYVQYQTQMWTNNFLAQVLLKRFVDSHPASAKELFTYYNSTKNNYVIPERRKIIPIVVRDKNLADKIFSQIKAGGDFVALAKQYSINQLDLYKKDPGIYITPNSWGDAGKYVFKLKPGQVLSPAKVDENSYAVIKLVGVKNSEPASYDQVHDQVLSGFQDNELQNYVSKFLLKVVKNYKVKINREILGEVQYFGGSMDVKKTHFPLRNAVPGLLLLNHNARWYQEALTNDAPKISKN